MTLPTSYFERMYAASDDPWGFRTRWYERRKRALTDAVLTRPRYARAFEPGCSIGALTTVLAARCDALLATDTSEAAVRTARAELATSPHVEVRLLRVPDEWPDGSFDLVVVSELGYYLDDASLARLADRSVASLVSGGTLVACHWRRPVADYPVTGDGVHAVIGGHGQLHRTVLHSEEDFLLEVWTRGRVPSVAQDEGLVG